jgi:SAM-dependent methyltransferase
LSEYDRWETRYGVPDDVFGREPNYFLTTCKHMLPKSGEALAVADGEGRNGVWLAEQGLNVLSLDFSPSAQAKAAQLARERGVKMTIERGDVHAWTYPDAAFDVVCEVFTQFSTPAERARKWDGMKRTLKPAGLLILIGYTPKQLKYGTGGPKELANLYTRELLEETFGAFRDVVIGEEELVMHEGASHAGLSAVIHLTAYKPS